jgi:hypothetical protein
VNPPRNLLKFFQLPWSEQRPLLFSIVISADLLSIPLSGQRLLDALFLSRLEVERVLLYFFDDVLRLDLAFETTKGIFQRLSLLKPDFSHSTDTPQLF